MLPLPCTVLPLLKKRQWVLAGAVQVLVQDAAIFNQCHHCPSCSRRQHWHLAGLSNAICSHIRTGHQSAQKIQLRSKELTGVLCLCGCMSLTTQAVLK